ncbi:ABC transporter involved in cytochrome c biogenesis, CcmB subunit [hydrothermal vent metagenome]|uniref:Heme exporter protein B n=1 Tax=hydrothermal vent metagenome TaxID=652676 RepID=A0A3B0Y345_9ZZZZ
MKGASEAGTAHESSVVQSTSVTSLAHVPSTVSAFFALVKRDLMLSYRHRNELLNPLLFFVIVVILFPLGTSPEKQLLQTMAPGVIWVAALLAAMLSLDTLFKADYDDGTLEQIMLSPHSNSVMVLAKIISHWLVTGVPIILLAPLLGLFMYLPAEATSTLMLTLLLGTPVLSLVGAIGMALTLGLNRGGMLLSLLVLPLYIPVLIFSANAVDASVAGMEIKGQLYFLGALLALALTLAPLATASALKISVE